MKKNTQKSIYEKAGINQSTFSNIINGRRRPSWRIAKKLAIATDSSPDFWMEAEPDALKMIIKNTYQTEIEPNV